MKTKTTLGVEQLDRRDMPSISLVGGTLTMNGGGNTDVARVSLVGGQVQAKLYSYAPGSSVGIGQTISFDIVDVQKVVFNGGAGKDTFANNTYIPCIANGGAGRDVLWGGGDNDLLRGGNGQDFLVGRGGNDTLKGAAGNDKLYGGDGHDKLYGGANNDVLYGFIGVDILYGEGGNDYLEGGADGLPDMLWGGNPEGDTFKFEPAGPTSNLDEPQDATDPSDLIIW